MNDLDTQRLLDQLRHEPQPELSPYFEARLRRAIAKDAARPRYSPAVRAGGLALAVFSIAILWQYPYLRWLIPLAILYAVPEDWNDALVKRWRRI